MTTDTSIIKPVEAGSETLETRAKPGRKPLPDGQKIKYHDERVSMREEYWAKLQEGAEALNVLSLSGKNRGKPSWRAMIRFLCENMDWVILAVKMIRSMDPLERATLWQNKGAIGTAVKVQVVIPFDQEHNGHKAELALPAVP